MQFTVFVGALAALAMWALTILALIGFGLLPAALSRPRTRQALLRRSLWWGLLIAVITVLATNLVLPLRSIQAAMLILGVLAALVHSGILVTRGLHLDREPATGWVRGSRALILVLALALVFLAFAAMGPVTNYDTGLYHLGALKYAGDYSTIPGLANLMNPFGYNNSEFPLAAVLGNGPWNGIGYRLLNAGLMAAVTTDLVLRLRARRLSVGTYVLLVSVIGAWIPMIALADYWVISPTSDSAVMLLTLVSVAYVADSAQDRAGGLQDGLVAIVVALVLISMRPTMIFFMLSVVMIVVIRTVRTARAAGVRTAKAPIAIAAGLAIALLAIQVTRDYLLSGWIEYPLSLFHFSVPWRAADPVDLRTATLGAARDPNDLWNAAQGWGWIPAWMSNALHQWETYFLALLLVCAVVMCVLAYRRGARSATHLLIALIPSTVAVAMWWLASPPSYRFIWGALFSLALLPLGWALHALHSRGARIARATPMSAVGMLGTLVLIVLLAYCAVARLHLDTATERHDLTLGPIAIPISVTALPLPPTEDVRMSTGLVLRVPTQSDQCWDVYPLCASGMGGSVGMRGTSIQDGFAH